MYVWIVNVFNLLINELWNLKSLDFVIFMVSLYY